MAYIPDWERLSDVLKRVTASDVSEDKAKLDICGAIADRKIAIRLTIAGTGSTVKGTGIEVPANLERTDFDWEKSVPNKLWFTAPRERDGESRLIYRWRRRSISLVELRTNDVSEWIRRTYGLRTGKAFQKVITTAAQETHAISGLAERLKANPNMTRDAAKEWCANQGIQLTARGFQDRVWPKARERAQLAERAPAGRKRKS